MLGGSRLAAGALALGMLGMGSFAAAQSASDALVERRDRIEVTGSRIITLDVESASPIATISAEEIRSEGYPSLELILNNFPQLVADQGSRVSNGATGTSTANLRGLLPERTLVLVNGRRLLSGSPFLLAGDLNQIPVHLVSRIEILTGGASAVHGSDAIAGVVNIILKDRFEGVEGSVAYDFYNHRQKNDFMAGLVRSAGYELPGDKRHDGATTSATLTLGGNFAAGKGNAAFSFRYLESEALLQTERDYSACALSIANFGQPDAAPVCGGSSTGYPGRFVDLGTRRAWTVADSAGGVRAWNRSSDLFNYAPWNYYQRPIERSGFNAFVNLDVSAAARVYAELGVHDDHTVAQIAPSGIFGGVWTIRHENPLLSDAWRSRLTFTNPDGTPGTGPGTVASVVIQRRNVEGGGRQSELRHTSFREVVGVKGPLAGPWDYDFFFQSAKVVASERYANDFSLTRVARALDAVRDPATGAPVCASAVDGSDRGCVPYDIWRLGGVTPEALAYLQVPALRRGYTSQTLLSATIRGELGDYGMRLPWTRNAVEVASGIERRTDKMDLKADAAFASGDLAGFGSSNPPVQGGVTVKELFGEVRVPILDSLSVTGSYRYSDYSTGAKSDTFGIGFNAAPARAVRLRGSYQRAVRAANLSELFTPQVEGGWGLFPDEPCAGTTPSLSLAECRRTGVTDAQYGNIPATPPGVGFPALYGGNPALEPETAKTVTLGIAFTPTRNFSATLDYFDIRIEDFIFGGTPEVTFQRCIDTGDPVFCGLITRDPALGTLWIAPAQVVATNQNIGRVQVSGADLAFNYRFGTLVSISAIGTYLHSFTRENYRGAEAVQCAGFYSGDCAEPRPKWRHRLSAAWHLPWNLEVATTWRHLRAVKDVDGFVEDLKAMDYFDLSASWALDKRVTLSAGINNVTDRDPPITAGAGAGTGNGNTYPGTYDGLGRHVFVSLSAKF